MSQKNAIIQRIIDETSKVIIGKEDAIQLTLAAYIAGGHVLYEDVPGIGKTMLVRTLAKVLGLSSNRIQFTPDMMPSDLIGVTIYNNHTNTFDFKKGPLFTDIVLADEINRTTPRTQSSLLEAMSEAQISQDGITYPLSTSFFVLATQNPSSYEGTYPLPEAQLDRFLMRLSLGYPSYFEELELVKGVQRKELLKVVEAQATRADIEGLKESIDSISIKDSLVEYALDLVRQTRKHPNIRLGVSPRGAIDLLRVSKAYAITEGREYVIPEDIIKLYIPVVSHRIHTRSSQEAKDRILQEILDNTKVPV